MDKILAALAELKSYFSGIKETLANLKASEERNKQLEANLTELEGQNAKLQSRLDSAEEAGNSEFEVQIKQLNDDLVKTRKEAAEREKNLQAQLEAAQAETTKVKGLIAAQGIPLDLIPAGETPANPAKANEVKGNLTEQCLAANKKLKS